MCFNIHNDKTSYEIALTKYNIWLKANPGKITTAIPILSEGDLPSKK